MTFANRLFDEIEVGDTADARRVCTDNDLYIFAHASGNLNPLNLPDRDGDGPLAEVLIVPNLEAGNMLAKELTFIAHAEAAGLVIGAMVPVMLTSRADGARGRGMDPTGSAGIVHR
jgi:hypothetical protein